MSESFDRAMALLGAPDVRASRPATIMDHNALLGHRGTHIVQTAYSPEEGWTLFAQVIDAANVTQVVFPPQVCKAIFRQFRSTAARPKRKMTPEEVQRKKVRDARELLKKHRAGTAGAAGNGGKKSPG